MKSLSIHLEKLNRGGGGVNGRERDREYKKNYHLVCPHVPLVLSTIDHNKQGLILVLFGRIPVTCSHG